MSKNSDRPHVVDHDNEKVYLVVNSWGGAMAAPHWTAKHYPGYKTVFVTEQTLTEKKTNDRTENPEE